MNIVSGTGGLPAVVTLTACRSRHVVLPAQQPNVGVGVVQLRGGGSGVGQFTEVGN